MGDITEMMEEGILCQQCGVYIEDTDQVGTWTTCSTCRPHRRKKSKHRKESSHAPVQKVEPPQPT